MTLSKREKRMLYLLGCFILVAVGVYLFILPAAATRAALSQQLEELEAQRLVRVQSIARMGALDTRAKALRKEITTGANRYAPLLNSDVLDGTYTSMLRRYNAHPTELVIGELAEDTAIPHYGEKTDSGGAELTIAEVPPLEDYMAAVKPDGGTKAEPPVEPPPAIADKDAPITRTQALSLSAIIKPADAIAFLAELSAKPYILVQTVNLSEIILVSNVGGVPVTTTSSTLTVEFLNLLVPDLSELIAETPGLLYS